MSRCTGRASKISRISFSRSLGSSSLPWVPLFLPVSACCLFFHLAFHGGLVPPLPDCGWFVYLGLIIVKRYLLNESWRMMLAITTIGLVLVDCVFVYLTVFDVVRVPPAVPCRLTSSHPISSPLISVCMRSHAHAHEGAYAVGVAVDVLHFTEAHSMLSPLRYETSTSTSVRRCWWRSLQRPTSSWAHL